jgi:hypothetical protein
MRTLPLLLALAGCAGAGPWPSAPRGDELAPLVAGRAAGPAESCVASVQNTSLRVIDSRTLVYDRGRTVWVNRLRDACPGLRRDDALIVETHGSRYCRNDRIRAFEPYRSIPGPVCLLGDFVPYRRR